MNLVLLETSGNQNYIFSTNKLRENVGASQLTSLAGTRFVLQAVEAAGGAKDLWTEDGRVLRANLAAAGKNPPIEEGRTKVEVLLATSGKAILITDSRETARQIVRQATLTALKEAPGLDVCGIISRDFDWGRDPLHELIREAHEQFQGVRAELPSPLERFPLLPVVEICRSSGFPASDFVKEGTKEVLRSAISLAKNDASGAGITRITHLAKELGHKLARNLDRLERDYEELDWLAVVHADGNAVGRILMSFHEYAGLNEAIQNRQFANRYREFSLALEESTERAFVGALAVLSVNDSAEKHSIPMVPLILGGDDLTVICHGRLALPFTVQFLRLFESETARRDRFGGIIPKVALAALGRGNLSACAGIAITKPHFPFFTSYTLAEQLLRSAKTVKERIRGAKGAYPCSALDFHILYDSSVVDLEAIRDRLVQDGGNTTLTAKPYTVSKLADEDRAALLQGSDWLAAHDIEHLKQRIAVFETRSDEDGSLLLPSSQLHELREGLFEGWAAADDRMRRIRHRYDREAFDSILEDTEAEPVSSKGKGSLFRQVVGEQRRETRFLDALDAADFWKESAS